MTKYTSNFKRQKDFFIKAGIDVALPGFYDDPKFISLERTEVNILKNYASFVKQRPYSESYLLEAEKKIKIITQVLYDELLKDGREGACIDMSAVLSRILDMEGIWNFPQSGSLTITFPERAHLPKRFFWTIADGNFKAGHAWLCAPPFQIIDLTLKRQPYRHNEREFLPDYVLQKETWKEQIDLTDLVQDDILLYQNLVNRNNPLPTLKKISSDLPVFSSFFQPEAFTVQEVMCKYTAVGINFSELPLEQITSLKLSNKWGYEIYRDLIQPQL